MAIELIGNWRKGFALDLHTESSEYLGVDANGRDQFETKRTEIGELLYRLKYKADKSVLPQLVKFILQINGYNKMDRIIPAPPSNTSRHHQPVFMIGEELSKNTGVQFVQDAIVKSRDTPQLKQIHNPEEREQILTAALELNPTYNLSGMNVLIIDDLYRSGATLNTIAKILYDKARVANVYVLTLTKTRSLR